MIVGLRQGTAFSLVLGFYISYLSFRLVRNLSEEGLPTSGNDIRNITIRDARGFSG